MIRRGTIFLMWLGERHGPRIGNGTSLIIMSASWRPLSAIAQTRLGARGHSGMLIPPSWWWSR